MPVYLAEQPKLPRGEAVGFGEFNFAHGYGIHLESVGR
jgi:hypothetical protein